MLSQYPLLEVLLSHRDKQLRQNASSYHVPGHKSGELLKKLNHETKEMIEASNIFDEIFTIDVTEITGMDDLHQPEGAISAAQNMAAQYFGADHTFFLVNGSTAGNMALILSVCSPGDLIISSRNIHKSVIHGFVIAGIKVVFLPSMSRQIESFSLGDELICIDEALNRYPDAKAVWITNPDYYGAAVDLEGIVELVHRYDKPLLVDEAHGAHFGLHPALPKPALSCGADGVVQSTHKMLTAMTMGSMLHLKGERIDKGTVQQRLAMLQSSSPSYPIMASLDFARGIAEHMGKEWTEIALARIEMMKETIKRETRFGVKSFQSEYCVQDPFKLVLFDQTCTLNGYQLMEALENKGCYLEMADPRYVLIVLSMVTPQIHFDHLIRSLKEVQRDYKLEKKENAAHFTNVLSRIEHIQNLTISEPIDFNLKTWNQFQDQKQTKEINIELAEGETSAEMITPYPPGIPILFPGERITHETIRQLQQYVELGAKLHRALDTTNYRVRVYRPNEENGGAS